MKKIFAALALTGVAASSFAQFPSATGSFTSTPNGGVFNYTITLQNTGTLNIGQFWFAWIPDINFMIPLPTAIGSPTGWNPIVSGFGGPFDGYGIQWTATGAANFLAAGASKQFTFTSAMTPSELSGPSFYNPHPPVGTSFVYEPTLAFGSQFVVTAAVPEPATLATVGLGLALLRRRRTRA